MKVKIVKHTSPNAWYRSDIGMVFDVHDYKYDNSYYEVGYSYNCILKADTIPVNELNQTVQCSWQVDLKSIVVRFENVEQRKAIFEKFESGI